MFFFHCQDLFMGTLKKKYSFLFFFLPVSVEAPYILHALPCHTVFDFLSHQHNKLCHFIPDIMNNSLAGKDQQQTNQPNDQASV